MHEFSQIDLHIKNKIQKLLKSLVNHHRVLFRFFRFNTVVGNLSFIFWEEVFRERENPSDGVYLSNFSLILNFLELHSFKRVIQGMNV